MRAIRLAFIFGLVGGLFVACADGDETESTPAGPAGPSGPGGMGGSAAGPSSGGAGGQGDVCDAGYADCDDDPNNGCETYTVSHALHCGACDNACPTGPNASANCSDSVCQFDCQQGWADCDQDQSTGCEAHLATSTEHCGGCDMGCNGTCVDQMCDPSSNEATGQNHPLFITSDSTNLYWVNVGTNPNYLDGQVMQKPIMSGTPQVVVSAVPFPSELAVDANNIYYAAYGPTSNAIGYIASVPIGGGTPTTLAPAEAAIGLAIDSTHVYWANAGASSGTGSLQRVPLGGGTVDTLVPNLTGTFAVSLDATYVYFSTFGNGNDGTIQRVLKAGGTPQVLATSLTSPYDLALDTTNIYFSEADAGTVGMVPQIGGTAIQLAGATTPLFVLTDSTAVYFTDAGQGPNTGFIRRLPLGGGNVTILASGQDSPYGITVQGNDMYWANLGDLTVPNTGAIRTAPK